MNAQNQNQNPAKQPSRMIAAPTDPIRVVPLHMPNEAGAALEGIAAGPAPHLTDRGGPLLTAVEVFTIFWGAAWQQAPQSTLAGRLNEFFNFVLTSPLINQLAEYNRPSQAIGHGTLAGTTTVTHPAPRHSVTDSAIQHMLQQEIASNLVFPQPSPNRLYFVYLPPGVAVVQGGSRSCQAFCGYHDNISGQIFYAVMPYPNCAGCTGGLDTLNALTSTSSHELCEAITDAIPGQGWYDDTNGEIGDICAWKTKQIGAYTVQQEWSNAQNQCL